MKTNDIKKGMVIQLNNGWYGIMADNMRGNTRMVDVDGMFREMGSVYSHDIKYAYIADEPLAIHTNIPVVEGFNCVKGHVTKTVEHTPAQLKLKERVLNSGF